MLRKRTVGAESIVGESVKTVTRAKVHRRISVKWLGILGGVLFLVYGAFPLSFYFSPWFRRFLIFGHYANWPPLANYSDTESYNLPFSRNFFIQSSDNVMLGTWHIMPKTEWVRCSQGVHPEAEFSDSRPVIIYYHGHAEARNADYRVQLYRTLSQGKVDAHVITFDYRGFADSTNVMPNREGVLKDSLAVYEWVKRKVPRSRIIVWGHSLGSGVAAQLGEIFARTDDNPAAIVLEAPFNSLIEAAKSWPLCYPFYITPSIMNLIDVLGEDDDTHYESEKIIGKLTTPILVMHSKDDPLVPYRLGRKLFDRLVQDRPTHLSKPIFYEVDSSVGPGHRRIYKDPKVSEVVAEFVNSVVKSANKKSG